MKFDAKSAPEALDYDFSAWGVDAKGTVPEPTQDALGTFLDYFDALSEENKKATEQDLQAKANALQAKVEETVTVIGDLPDPDPEPEVEPEPELEKRTWRQIILGEDDKAREFVDHVGGLCQNQPTADQIWALPPRIRRSFNDMVINLFVFGKDDQGKADAGTNS